MDADAVRQKRQAALEEKRARLERLRKERENRAAKKAEKETEAPASSSSSRADVDILVNSLLQGTNLNADEPPPAPTSTSTSVPHSTPVVISDEKPGMSSHAIRRSEVVCVVSSAASISIPPGPKDTYEKEIQTDEVEEDDDLDYEDDIFINRPTPRKRTPSSGNPSPINTRSLSIAPTIDHMVEHYPGSSSHPDSPTNRGKTLTDDDITEIVSGDKFQCFLINSARVMERILSSTDGPNSLSSILLRDYTSDDTQAIKNENILNVRGRFDDVEGWLKFRPVHFIENNPHYPELLAVAYGQTLINSQTNKSDWVHSGGVGVWNYATPQRPEFRFAAPAAVLVTVWHPFSQHLLLGGCSNGMLVGWDTRSKREDPVQRSSLSGEGHKYAIKSISFVGSSTNYEIVSVSTDGMVCHWDFSGSGFAEPVRCTTMKASRHHQHKDSNDIGSMSEDIQRSHDVHVSAMSFGKGTLSNPFEIRQAFVGTQDGGLLDTTLPLSSNNEFGGIPIIGAHGGIVTGLAVHPRYEKGYNDLLLTSSVDWTVKLWNISQSMGQAKTEPVLEFRNNTFDYVVDVRWSSLNPTLFATVTSACDLVLWNITESSTDPASTLRVVSDDGTTMVRAGLGQAAERIPPKTLNTLCWSSDGRRVLVGDNHGAVHVVTVAESTATPVKGDSARFEMSLLQQRKIDGHHIVTGTATVVAGSTECN
jgi:dynein intermediate chain, cytosolic